MTDFLDNEELDFGFSKPKKVYRGAYTYLRNNNIYSEETFEVWRDRKEMTYNYVSEIHTRVSTGELLKVFVNYQVGKDFVPNKVVVKKDLGKEKAEETYTFNSKKNILTYQFKSKRNKKKLEISTPPRFHISTPAASCSMLFILTKKFDTTGKNLYSIVSSFNKWEFERELVTRSFILERISLTSESMNIGGQEVQAIQYKLYEGDKERGTGQAAPPRAIIVWLSRHLALPYIVQEDNGTKIQVKYLNNLEAED